MIAVMLTGSASTLFPLFAVVLMIPILLVFAPQAVRRDKRTIVGLLFAAAAVIGVPAYAAICNVCEACKGPYWYLFVECWFL